MNLEILRKQLRGSLVTPESSEYESRRRVWNAMIDRLPRAIACCSGPADIQAAVRFATEEGVHPAIRGGGHNAAGLAMVDDGLVIDVSGMKGIFVDPSQQTVIAQTGLTWGEFDRETHAYGLATTGGLISTTGIAGLTLGGGVGWLMGRCGLVCDNTLSYDLVLADGRLAKANAIESADLFWALKGGGGNFGVVTSITYRMYPIREVLAGLLLYPLSAAREVLRFYRDFTSTGIPDELTMYAGALSMPDGTPALALIPAWCGDLDEGERVLRPVRKFSSPIADLVTLVGTPGVCECSRSGRPEPHRTGIWHKLQAPSRGEDEVRSGESLPAESEYLSSIGTGADRNGVVRVVPEARASFGAVHNQSAMIDSCLWGCELPVCQELLAKRTCARDFAIYQPILEDTMTSLKNVAAGFCLVLAMLGSTSSRAQGESELLAGTTAQWWQYALSIPTTVNPLTDTSGADCMVGQRDPIWFLAGIFPGGTATRSCAVPAGEWLFFPVINSVQINAPGVCGQTGSLNVGQLRSLAAPFIDAATNMYVTVDGKSVKDLIRIKSDVFATTFPEDNIFNPLCGGFGTVPGGVYSPSVDDGYYVLLKPLSVGGHVLHIHAESSGGFVLDVSYSLDVVPVRLK
jgi:hypothetical protein